MYKRKFNSTALQPCYDQDQMPEPETMIPKKIDFLEWTKLVDRMIKHPSPIYENVLMELGIGQSYHFSAVSNLQITSHALTNTPGN